MMIKKIVEPLLDPNLMLLFSILAWPHLLELKFHKSLFNVMIEKTIHEKILTEANKKFIGMFSDCIGNIYLNIYKF